MRIRKDLTKYGFSTDKRKRRKEHRRTAREIIGHNVGVFGPSSSFAAIAVWHLYNARYFGR